MMENKRYLNCTYCIISNDRHMATCQRGNWITQYKAFTIEDPYLNYCQSYTRKNNKKERNYIEFV